MDAVRSYTKPVCSDHNGCCCVCVCACMVQWLVKRAMETRQEMGDYVRAYSISQFHKAHSMPQVAPQYQALACRGGHAYIYIKLWNCG